MPAQRYTQQERARELTIDAFPPSASYDPDWMLENLMGPNAVWLTEALCQALMLEPGMRVLDMGCGRTISSIFLAKEFDVQVWATDLWVGASDNWQWDFCSFHSRDWWRDHWTRTGLVEAITADTVPNGSEHWLRWLEVAAVQGYRSDEREAEMLRLDSGRNLGFTRLVARKV